MPTPGTARDEATKPCVAVLGSGSWGTALAVHLARTGHRAILWGIETEELEAMARERVNHRYLPDVALPDGVEIEHDFARAVAQSELLLLVVPSHAFREVLERARSRLRPGQRVAWATKGFELSTGKLPHEVATEVLGPGVPTAVLSGPTFAREVGTGLPSAMTVASRDDDFAMALAPYSRQLEAVIRTLNPDDPIELGMSNNDKLIYNVYSIKQMSPEEMRELDSNSPCLHLVLAEPDAEKRWVLTALP